MLNNANRSRNRKPVNMRGNKIFTFFFQKSQTVVKLEINEIHSNLREHLKRSECQVDKHFWMLNCEQFNWTINPNFNKIIAKILQFYIVYRMQESKLYFKRANNYNKSGMRNIWPQKQNFAHLNRLDFE